MLHTVDGQNPAPLHPSQLQDFVPHTSSFDGEAPGRAGSLTRSSRLVLREAPSKAAGGCPSGVQIPIIIIIIIVIIIIIYQQYQVMLHQLNYHHLYQMMTISIYIYIYTQHLFLFLLVLHKASGHATDLQ